MAEPMLPILNTLAGTPEVIKEIYGDLAKPGVQQVGKALGTVLGLGNTILWPIMLANERASIALRANLDKYRAKLESTPPEEVVTVPPEIGVPIAERLAYVTDDEISSLYVELLVNASTSVGANVAHPSFIAVIDNLSPDEAVLLQSLKTHLPVLRLRVVKNGTTHWIVDLERMLTGLEFKAALARPININAYLDNLQRLGLINLSASTYIAEPKVYVDLKRLYADEVEKIEKNIPSHHPELTEGDLKLTKYGQLFFNSCSIKLGS